MDLKTRILELLDLGHSEEMALVEALTREERAVSGTPDAWSVKDVVAHNNAWKEQLVWELAAVARDEDPTRDPDVERQNARFFEDHRHRTWEEIEAYAAQSRHALAARAQAMTSSELESLDTLPSQQGRPLWRQVVGVGFSHPLLHLIEEHRKRGDMEKASALSIQMATSLSGLDESPDWQGTVRYNLACHYSLSGLEDKAILALKEALALNPELTDWSKEDPDFDSIRDRPEYRAIYGG